MSHIFNIPFRVKAKKSKRNRFITLYDHVKAESTPCPENIKMCIEIDEDIRQSLKYFFNNEINNSDETHIQFDKSIYWDINGENMKFAVNVTSMQQETENIIMETWKRHHPLESFVFELIRKELKYKGWDPKFKITECYTPFKRLKRYRISLSFKY